MATEYDPRRPRLPKELAARVDAVRGQDSFNETIVAMVEAMVLAASDYRAPVPSPAGEELKESYERQLAKPPPTVASAFRRSEPGDRFKCPSPGCQWTGAKPLEDLCPKHRRNLVPR